MGSQVVQGLVSIAAAVIGLAALSVILSRNAATTQVIQAASQGFGSILGIAISPVGSGAGRYASPGSGNIINLPGLNFP